jgi:Winged helix-turn helix
MLLTKVHHSRFTLPHNLLQSLPELFLKAHAGLAATIASECLAKDLLRFGVFIGLPLCDGRPFAVTSPQQTVAGRAEQADRRAQGAVHGVVRWRACDLIMRLHEEFGIFVSDDTVYRALKDLGFAHLSARPKAYKQNPDDINAFKKTFLPAWRKSRQRWHRAHR